MTPLFNRGMTLYTASSAFEPSSSIALSCPAASGEAWLQASVLMASKHGAACSMQNRVYVLTTSWSLEAACFPHAGFGQFWT